MPDIQPADPEARRKAIALLLVMCVLLLPLLWWLNANLASLESWIAQPEEAAEHAVLAIALLVASGVILLLVVAGYVNQLANSILSTERYPPPDIKVIKDTQIRRGKAARRIGKLLKGYVVVVLLLMAALIIVGWQIIQTVNEIAG